MKKISYKFLVVMALMAMLVSACGAATAAPSAGLGKGQASLVEFTGVIEAMVGDQWTVNGEVITVDPALLGANTFTVGDTIKVELEVQDDGSLVVTSVEASETDDNTNDVNSNDSNVNDSNSNDSNVNDVNSNDDDENENEDVNDNDDDEDDDVNDNGDDDESNDNGDDDDDNSNDSDDDSGGDASNENDD